MLNTLMEIGPWLGIAWGISIVWLVCAIRNAPDFDEYMSGEWDRKRRHRRK